MDNLDNSFNNITNRSAEKLQSNSIFHNFDTDNSNNRPVTRRSQISNILNENQMENQPVSGYCLMKMENINDIFSNSTVCGQCKKGGMKLFENVSKRKGLCQTFFSKCSNCSASKTFRSSNKVSPNGAFDINLKSVHAACQGSGYAGFKKICSSLDLPQPVTKKPFNNLLKKTAEASANRALSSSKNAARKLILLMQKENPESVTMLELLDKKIVADVAVSVDGTWQKRGHSSRIGVVFILSIDTGEVLDYVIKSLVCHECSAHSRWDKKSEKYKNWCDKHKATCYINHSGSSDSMETQGAVEMFLRSIDKNGLRYTTFVGDGDSNCYASVCEALRNAPTCYSYEVKKEECVGHIQKRIGTALREYKKKNERNSFS